LAISDYVISFLADVVGVLIGASLGYLLGLRQQRKIDTERREETKRELKDALKDELAYVQKEVRDEPKSPSEIFGELAFSPVFLDLPTFTSIVNSGQLLLLDAGLIRSLRELNKEIHEHNIAQTTFMAVGTSLLEGFKRTHEGTDEKPSGRIASVLKVVLSRRETIVQQTEELIQKLSEP
jgi:hypothetical protein